MKLEKGNQQKEKSPKMIYIHMHICSGCSCCFTLWSSSAPCSGHFESLVSLVTFIPSGSNTHSSCHLFHGILWVAPYWKQVGIWLITITTMTIAYLFIMLSLGVDHISPSSLFTVILLDNVLDSYSCNNKDFHNKLSCLWKLTTVKTHATIPPTSWI